MTQKWNLMFFLVPFMACTVSFGQYEQSHHHPTQREKRPHLNYPKNFIKSSIGFSSLDNYSDASGDLIFEDSSIVPIQLAYGVAMGNINFEGEFTYNHYDFQYNAIDPNFSFFNGDLFTSQIMLNGYFKSRSQGLHFYLGGGFGVLMASMEGEEQDLSGSSLAVQAMLGLEFNILNQSGFYVEYRHLETIGLELENDFAIVDFDYEQSGFHVGFRYYF